MSIQTRIKKSTLSKMIWIKVSLRLYNDAYTLLKEFEYEIPALMSEDKVNMINVKLNRLHKLKSEEKDARFTDYYIENAYKYPVYSHLGELM